MTNTSRANNIQTEYSNGKPNGQKVFLNKTHKKSMSPPKKWNFNIF